MKKTFTRCAFLAALAVGVSTPAMAGDLKLSMQNGRVTLIADNVPVRQILQEWARIGQAQIVNADRVSGPTLTLQLVDVPEKDALDILLRSAAGYIAAPRPAVVANAAYYDRITILATSRAPAASASMSVPPPFQRPAPVVDDVDEPINVTMPPQQPQMQPQNPMTTQFPGIQPVTNQQPTTATQPGPMTSPRPGALPQPMPNAMPNPYQPGTVVRPGGGPGGPGGPGGIN